MPRRVFVLIVVLFLAALAARALPGPRTIDDAFITFRYSRNLLEGQGFVYNPGVRTLGTTTPLFTLVMAGMGAAAGGQDFQQYAIIVSALADGLTCVLLFLIARRALNAGHAHSGFALDLAAAIPGLLWAASPMSVTFAVGGMETSVNILWMIAAFWLYTMPQRRPIHEIGVGICAALGVITRIDAVLWVAPLFGWQLIESLRARRIPWRTWGAAALTAAPWFLFAWGYFGSPIPNSISAKSAAYQMPPLSALVRLIQTYATPFSEFETFGGDGVRIGSVVYLLLNVFGLMAARRALPGIVPLLIYPYLYFVVFSIANPLIFRWYLAPPLPAWSLGIFLGVWAILTLRFPRRDPTRQSQTVPRRAAPLIAGVMGAVWLFTSVNGWTLQPDHGPQRPAPRMAWHALELEYQAIGEGLRDVYGVTAETRVGSADIGAVGYFSRAAIVDTVGLVTPELRRYYPFDPAILAAGQNYAIPPALIRDSAPEYLVTMEGFVREGLEREAWFREAYATAESIPFPFYGSAVVLYERR
ncbi:MAG: hypothetical protein SF162_12455 [bacterium]|nr:hypothetical protein [bacterium]